jgi:hypothetical protein
MGFKPLLHDLPAALLLESFFFFIRHISSLMVLGCLGPPLNLNKCYSLQMSNICIITTTQSSSTESFHPFVNSPLACTFSTILNCHSSINSLICTDCNQTFGYTSFLFSVFSEWGSSTIRSTLRPTEDQISANEGVYIVISIIIFITVRITFELTYKCISILYFILILAQVCHEFKKKWSKFKQLISCYC